MGTENDLAEPAATPQVNGVTRGAGAASTSSDDAPAEPVVSDPPSASAQVTSLASAGRDRAAIELAESLGDGSPLEPAGVLALAGAYERQGLLARALRLLDAHIDGGAAAAVFVEARAELVDRITAAASARASAGRVATAPAGPDDPVAADNDQESNTADTTNAPSGATTTEGPVPEGPVADGAVTEGPIRRSDPALVGQGRASSRDEPDGPAWRLVVAGILVGVGVALIILGLL